MRLILPLMPVKAFALLSFIGCASGPSAPKADCSGRGNLAATALCFHTSNDAKLRYGLLSKASQEAVDFTTWQGLRSQGNVHDDGVIASEDCRTEALLGIRSVAGGPGAETTRLVELRRSCAREGRRCSVRESRVWQQEPEGWRRVTFPSFAQKAGGHWNEQRHQKVVPVVSAWLDASPYSVAAHRFKAWSLLLEEGNAAARTEHLAAMGRLNPVDSQTQLIAATLANTFETGSAAVKEMAEDDCFRGLAVRNVLRLQKDPQQAIGFLDQIDPQGAQFLISRLRLYRITKQTERAKALAQGQPFRALFKRLQKDKDQGSRRFLGMRVGNQLTRLGLTELAAPWLALAGAQVVKQQPNSKDCRPSIKNDEIKPPQNGLHTAYDMACRVTSKGHYQGGKRQGLWVFNHFMSEEKKAEGNYVAGQKQGRWTEFDSEGKVETQLHYKDGRKHGLAVSWFDFVAKTKSAEGNFADGERDGPWVFFGKDGSVDRGRYDAGQRVGAWIQRGTDGTVLREGGYASGKPHGDWLYRGQDGSVKRGRYLQGKQVGLWEKKGREGQLLQRIEMDSKGHEGHFEDWYPDGQRRSVGRLIGLQKNGLWKGWHPNGKPSYEGHFKTGKQAGVWKVWFANGGLKAVFNFDKQEGQCWTEEGAERPCSG